MKQHKNDSLGDRMKRYEEVSKTRLVRRMPVIIRLDGRAFHSFTRGFNKPFDEVLMNTMAETTKYLCENIQGCVFGYTQSDEITLILEDYHDINITPWFDNEVQKFCSVSASMATLKFNQLFDSNVNDWYYSHPVDCENKNDVYTKQYDKYLNALTKGAMFDSRCFNVPVADVCNCIIWRQKDAERNSIQMAGQSQFSHKELQHKTCNEIQDMLHEQKGINWNDYPTVCKRGTAVIKDENGKWLIDTEMPILTQDRDYIESRINFDNEEEELVNAYNQGYANGYKVGINNKENLSYD